MDKSLSKKLLSDSVFMTKPTDSLATLDVYTKNNREIVNKIQDINRIFDVDSTNIMKGGALVTESFPVLSSKTGESLKINSENLTARISSISRTVSSSLGGLSSGIMGGIKNTIGDIKLPDQVYSIVDGVKSTVSSVDFSGLAEVTNVIQNITGNTELMSLVDPNAEASLYIGLISEASHMGIPDSFSSVVDNLTNPDVKGLVMKNVLSYAIDNSDVRMLSSMVDVDDEGNLHFSLDNVIQEFSSKYKQGFGFDKKEQVEEYALLRSTFYNMYPDWDKKSVINNGGSTDILDISKLTRSSKDFKESLLSYLNFTDEPNSDEVMMALIKVFGYTTVERELKSMFPYLIISKAVHT